MFLDDGRANPMEIGMKGYSAISIAAQNYELEIVKLILKKYELIPQEEKISPENQRLPEEEITKILSKAISLAAENGELEIVKSIAGLCKYSRENANLKAAEQGHTEIVKYLFTNFKISYSNCNLAATAAVNKGHFETAEFLFTDDRVSFTRFVLAPLIQDSIKRGDSQIVKLLLAKAHPDIEHLIQPSINRGDSEVIKLHFGHYPGLVELLFNKNH